MKIVSRRNATLASSVFFPLIASVLVNGSYTSLLSKPLSFSNLAIAQSLKEYCSPENIANGSSNAAFCPPGTEIAPYDGDIEPERKVRCNARCK